ncbi:MAG: hypothetical protein KAI47_25075 [Deltaproteobacteria bacterium]|nr:hypothetical protein [Deltaproteobacteria bacterium]
MNRSEYYVGPAQPARVLMLTQELEGLLERYLETVPETEPEPDLAETEAAEALAEFSVPRSHRVDDLLRRVQLDGEEHPPAELARYLRDHLEAVKERRPPVSPVSSAEVKWRKRTASDIHRMVGADVRARVESYVERVAIEDEDAHLFMEDHESTLKGVPPGNSSPIGLARKKYLC